MIIDKILIAIFGSKAQRDMKALTPILQKVNEKEAWAKSLEENQFPKETQKLKDLLKQGKTLEDILPQAFALAREAAWRVRGERAFDVQIMGAIVLNSGKITEMKTGEGKTLVAVIASYLNSLTGLGVHIVTVNDYLAQRDADTMRPVFSYLGVTVGSILSNMDNEARKKAYNCDITYGTNNELGFDYLRDNMQIDVTKKVQRGFVYCIVDEIDSILIDEARTPLIISGQGEDDTAKFYEVDKYVDQFQEVPKDPKTDDYPDEVDMTPEQRASMVGDFKLDEKSKRVSFTDKGMNKINDILQKHNLIQGTVFDEENFEYVHYFTQAIRAHKLYSIDVDYVIKDAQVQIVDEFTGRILEGRRYSDGLHQAIEAKEHIKIAQRNRTMATITFQNFFRMYEKLSGMTGTAETEAVEFDKIYKLEVVVIPTNRPIIRQDQNDEVYLNENDKWEAICREIQAAHQKGQPLLVGTVSVEKSERLSSLLTKKGIRHEVLNAKNHAREALIIAEAGAKGAVTIATNMAGRGTDIKLGGNPEFRALKRAGTEATREQYEEAYKIEKEKWQKDYEEVKAAGGLYVIGTERHESRRIDNQLRGRSGRQGDPGKSKFYISMDDDLMRLFGGEKMKAIMTKIGMEPGEPINHPWLNKGIENAQKKVEERNFEIRKHLIDYDDVLNEQRSYIYAQRDSILSNEDLPKHVMNTAAECVDELLNDFQVQSRKKDNNAMAILQQKVQDLFGFSLPQERLSKEGIISYLQNDITEKETLAGHENLNMFIRYQYIQLIDRKWLDQLEYLDALREAVHLRSYGSKNPLTEYKIDGFDMFDTLIDSIRNEIVSRVFKVKIQVNPPEHRGSYMKANMQARHQETQSFSGVASRKQAASGAMQKSRQAMQNITVVRSSPKIGRNAPCPCGSGKKYKNCHGR